MKQLNKKKMMSDCPKCGEKNIGRLSKYIYFCRECCAEVVITRKNGIYVNIHSEDGIVIRKIKVG